MSLWKPHSVSRLLNETEETREMVLVEDPVLVPASIHMVDQNTLLQGIQRLL